MFRKLSLAIVSCVALVAFMGLAGSASAGDVVHADCDGDPYNNDAVIHDFELGTPDSHKSFAPSGIKGGALVCGTRVFNCGPGNLLICGRDSYYDRAEIGVANGVEITDTASIPTGAYAGRADVHVITDVLSFPSNQTDSTVLTVKPKGEADCPGNEVACYRGQGGLGHNYNWTVQDPVTGKYTLVIGKIIPIAGEAGLVKIDMMFCEKFGAPGTSQCGSGGAPVVQKNGAASLGKASSGLLGSNPTHQKPCSNGNGTYEATATQRGGLVTPSVTSCVVWGGGTL